MDVILNYKITETIDEGEYIVIYRGFEIQDNKPVLVKTLKTDYPTLIDVARLRHEYEITKNLNIEGVVKSYGIEKYLNGLAIILEDFGAQTLKTRIASSKINVVEFLKIAIQLTEILANLHQNDVIHKDIKPSSIFINPDTTQVKLSNFGIASRLSWENQQAISPSQLEGSLAYMSPEQTGRMNRSIDYRTDFYSLGVTFYEMLTGRLPFQTTDPLELVHSHIAKKPVPPCEINLKVCKSVSEIVMKLLSKTAEDRYQVAYGIKADLERCLDEIETKGEIDSFELGKQDISNRLQIPQKLYGRDQEIALLMSVFDRVSQEKSELMLVSGYSGIGKSALVNEIHKPIVYKDGYYISGKFDQMKRNVPYNGISQAFQELTQQILTENEAGINIWREQFLSSLGSNGQVIIDVIPELELIIGKQPAIQQLGTTESQNRFNMTFQKFMNVFATKEHPLVIFLDDLQWADSSSLKLIELLMTESDSRYLLMIGAYRDNEVSAVHPLILMLENIKKRAFPVSHINLYPLNIDHITQFLADTFQCKMELVKPMAELILEKTDGNPFFMIEFLKAAYQNGMLMFNQRQGCWEWDLGKIQNMEATGNVIELMTAKILKCSKQTQDILTEAACIGNKFDLNTLSIIRQEQPDKTAAQLWEALQVGLILPIGSEYKYLDIEYQTNLAIQYKFLHDRVQQAAYSMVPEDDKVKIHLRIGQLLLENTSEIDLEYKIFEIINHLNIAIKELLPDPNKRIELARLNLIAGQKAKASNFYEPALRYFRVGVELLPENSWEDLPELTFSLYIGQVECEYLNGNFDIAREYFDTTIKNARTNLEKATAYNISATLYINMSQYKEAVEAGLKGLKLVGISLPKAPRQITIIMEILKAKKNLTKKKVEDLIYLPDMIDPAKKIAMNLLMNITIAAYFTNQNLLALVVLKGVNLSLRYGNTDASPLAYCLYAMIIGSKMGDYKTGDDFGHLALNLMEKSSNYSLKGRIYFVFGTLINLWRSPIITSLGYLEEGLKYCMDSGDLIYAGNTLDCIMETMLQKGSYLDYVYNESQKYLEFAKRIKVQHAIDGINIVKMMYTNLKHLTNDQFTANVIDLDIDEQPKEKQVKVAYCVYKCQLLYLFENYTEAMKVTDEVAENLELIFGTATMPEFLFYHSLILTAVYSTEPSEVQGKHWKILKKNQTKMSKWAKNCHENFLHRYLIVEAEMARVTGDDQKAKDLYDQAINYAHQNEYFHHEAIADELAAKLYIAEGKDKIAGTYIKEACYNYLKWGATAKIQALRRKYNKLISQIPSITDLQKDITTISSSSELDLTTVIKASQAISSEIVLEKLLEKLMKITIENAGAQRGFLILEEEGEYVIEAEGTIDKDEVIIFQHTLTETSDNLSSDIINYVIRTEEKVVLNDATNEGIFTADPYIIRTKPKSILCMPFIKQAKLTGLLYLENNLTTNAFPPERLDVLSLLASQAAISIENARFYAELDERVTQRTNDLSKANERLQTQHEEATHELDEAHKMQISLMPESAPSIKGFDIAGFSHPTREVEGDFFDYLMMADGKIGIAVADISGKGLKGAMNAVFVNGMLHEVAKNETSCGKILSVLNSDLYPRMEKLMYCSLILAVLYQNTRKLEWANAAQPYPIIRRGDHIFELDSGGDLPLSMKQNLTYADRELELQDGDIIVFYTDGIIEATNEAKEMYEIERLEEVIANINPTMNAKEIIETIIKDVTNFVGSENQYDDITIVVVKSS